VPRAPHPGSRLWQRTGLRGRVEPAARPVVLDAGAALFDAGDLPALVPCLGVSIAGPTSEPTSDGRSVAAVLRHLRTELEQHLTTGSVQLVWSLRRVSP
jgi:hypothetical protein